MPPELNVTLNIAQIVLLGGCLVGFGRMRQSLDHLTKAHEQFAADMKAIAAQIVDMAGRVKVLEDRSERRRDPR